MGLYRVATVSNPFEEAKRKLRPAIERKDFHVFVFGPSLQIDQVLPKPVNPIATHGDVETHARYLRLATRLELQKLGYSVDYGESPDVLEFWQKNFLAPDPATIEVNHAERVCGAIVVYPSSVGSICELGLFASRQWVCQKTLAIVHELYENDPGFFRQGLLEYFEQEGGRHSFQNYFDHDLSVDKAVKFVNKCYNSLQNAKVMHEQTGNRLKLTING
jgi:hypothetical protein